MGRERYAELPADPGQKGRRAGSRSLPQSLTEGHREEGPECRGLLRLES